MINRELAKIDLSVCNVSQYGGRELTGVWLPAGHLNEEKRANGRRNPDSGKVSGNHVRAPRQRMSGVWQDLAWQKLRLTRDN